MGKKLLRRDVLKKVGMGVAAVGAVFSGRQIQAQEACSKPFSQMERHFGVSYTDQERKLLGSTLDGYLNRIKNRRLAFVPQNHQAPAMAFNPLMKHEIYKEMGNTVSLSSHVAGPLPVKEEDIAFASVWKQAQWLRTSTLTSYRLTKIYLKRIGRYANELECFATVTADTALKQAKVADHELMKGHDRGLLHGIPYALKDLIDTADIPTTWGAKPYEGRIPSENATIVDRLSAAGAVLVGKTTLGALAYGDKWHGGITRNPWARQEGSSGSSAGSAAAVSAGLVSFSIGSETLGSIVSPANRCGVVGLRPTFGRVPRTGAMALCWSLDKIGPLSRYVEDTALVLHALNGGDDEDISSFDWGFEYDGLKANTALRIGYDPAWFKDAGEAEKKTLEHLCNAGMTLVDISLPDLPYETLGSILEVEAAAAFEELTLSDKDDLLGWQEDVAWPNTFRAARFHSAVEMMQLDRFRRHVMQVMHDMFKDVDMLVSPATVNDLLFSTNFTGHPCLTLPVGFMERDLVPLTGQGEKWKTEKRALPRNIVLWGNMLREDQLIKVGHILEAGIAFHENRPSML